MDINTLNAEITKSFGSEMAKLYSGAISEEELRSTAADAFNKLTAHQYSYGKALPSKLDTMIQELLVEKLKSYVEEIFNQPKVQEQIKKDAEEIVKLAREKSSEMLVDALAQNIVIGITRNPANDSACILGNQIAQEIYRLRGGY